MRSDEANQMPRCLTAQNGREKLMRSSKTGIKSSQDMAWTLVEMFVVRFSVAALEFAMTT